MSGSAGMCSGIQLHPAGPTCEKARSQKSTLHRATETYSESVRTQSQHSLKTKYA